MIPDPAKPIRRRLLVLLLRAFVIMMGLGFLLLLILNGLALVRISNALPAFLQTSFKSMLETYYASHGSWDGVTSIFESEDMQTSLWLRVWQNAILLDANGRIVVFHNQTNSPRVGTLLRLESGEQSFPIKVDGRIVGRLVVPPVVVADFPTRYSFVANLLAPSAFTAIFLLLFMLVMSRFLIQRVVNPLAEVIAASRSVANGKLDARVPVTGPDDLRTLSDSFNQMASTLEKNDNERRQLLADIAHELRTPLSIIRGGLEGMLDGVFTADESHIAPVLQEAYLLERLIEDLRLLTLAETRQLEFRMSIVELNELAQRVCYLFQAEAEEKNIQLRGEPGPDPIFILADAHRTEEVISNLVGNALRYVPPGGIVQLKIEPVNAHQAALSVIDNGLGVPEAALPHLFDRFWRGEKSRSRASGGAGLGLAICKQLIEAQGGTISAENNEHGGLQIRFVLPRV